ncbi:class I SAM-dependent methyltransferase [Alteribacter keqinensis]|uniref:Class I SAM-dependent methyltransferase n=1 Tax=Alteribacter keqinensis TaxID=2483800 RepID=A0A3M7TML2_9BACI|nr:class I SAM-dependent methyltransferase [Alteribacter keqinensis]RNA66873.1 class I SAM-dependent methyltransferase [Alteribacter keqinensis]
MNDRVKNVYNELAHHYEHHVDQKSLYNTHYERPAMTALFPPSLEGKAVFDAGCAAGWYTKELALRGAVVTASDLSPEMVAAARRRAGGDAVVHQLDLEEPLPFENSSFDLIVSSLVLHYISDWQNVFKEFHRVLKPGGGLLFSVHHPFMDLKLSPGEDYFFHELLHDEWKTDRGKFTVPFYRRPLTDIMNDTLTYFALDEIKEPQPVPDFQKRDPARYEKLMTNPHFLIVKAIKK